MKLITLQFETTDDFEFNLNKLITLIDSSPLNSLILAPELILTGYSYNQKQKAIKIGKKAIPILKAKSLNKKIALTIIEEKNGNIYNTFYLFFKGKIIHTQSKYKLFVLNDEAKYFTPPLEDEIKIIEIDGLKIAVLICFELRFLDFWQKIKGADIILIPSMWGKPRKSNFETLTQAIAVMNQCFVVASNSANDDMAKSSGIITPFGIQTRDDNSEFIMIEANLNEITKMRRYMDVGLDKKRVKIC